MQTCKRLGIETVAVYSEADARAVCYTYKNQNLINFDFKIII